ncbi:hypothetical protein AWENTII_000392 [Aspergillus wentii]
MAFYARHIEILGPALQDATSDSQLRDGVRKGEGQGKISRLISAMMFVEKESQTLCNKVPQFLLRSRLDMRR